MGEEGAETGMEVEGDKGGIVPNVFRCSNLPKPDYEFINLELQRGYEAQLQKECDGSNGMASTKHFYAH